ncbi:MAG: GNAT family N-acetyltransferase [Candidatus Promineifilaceae bacterium]
MEDRYEIVLEENPEEEAWGAIGRGLSDFNRQALGYNDFERLCFSLRSPDGEIAGGVLGETYWEWLHIDLLWVDERLRGSGYGSQLMETAENEARKRGMKAAWLDTFSFQARAFYERSGYELFGELDNYPQGHRRFFMRKRL